MSSCLRIAPRMVCALAVSLAFALSGTVLADEQDVRDLRDRLESFGTRLAFDF